MPKDSKAYSKLSSLRLDFQDLAIAGVSLRNKSQDSDLSCPDNTKYRGIFSLSIKYVVPSLPYVFRYRPRSIPKKEQSAEDQTLSSW